MADTVNPIQIEKFLKGVDYPAKKEDLIKRAEQNDADENILNTLSSLSAQTFEKPTDVTKSIGELNKHNK